MAELRSAIGFGVAGNFAGHLEQAGEDADFAKLEVTDPVAPKGVFPFYIPSTGDHSGTKRHFLHTFPLSSNAIALPKKIRDDAAEGEEAEVAKLQLEPEIALLCHLEYNAGKVVAIIPERFGAYNDCSIRRPGARKISEKKNWGEDSKGVAEPLLKIDHLAPGGVLDHYRLVCFLERDGTLHRYGVDSAVKSYSYFHERLLAWLVERLNNQADEGPLESIASWLELANYPESALISIGATRYTPFGEKNFLRAGDRSVVVAYDERKFDLAQVREIAADPKAKGGAELSLLSQTVA
jgi:hypothetical protein